MPELAKATGAAALTTALLKASVVLDVLFSRVPLVRVKVPLPIELELAVIVATPEAPVPVIAEKEIVGAEV